MTKFVIKDGSILYLKKRNRKDNVSDKWKETRIGKLGNNIEPLFKHPITSIAYEYDESYMMNRMIATNNIQWDKRDIIKAIDFWINDKVLENDRILFLEGNLRDVEEIELKRLIKMRNMVQEMPSDAKFVRYGGDRNQRLNTWMLEFYQITVPMARSNTRYAFSEEFRMHGDGARFDFTGIADGLSDMADAMRSAFSTAGNAAADEISTSLGGGRHSDPEPRVTIHADSNGHIPPTITVRASERLPNGTLVEYDPNNQGHVRAFRRDNGNNRPIGVIIRGGQANDVVEMSTNSIFTVTVPETQFNRAITFSGSTLNDTTRQLSGEDISNSNPYHWIVTGVRGTNGNRFYRVVDQNRRIISSGFETPQAAVRYISEQRERYNQPVSISGRWIRESEFDESNYRIVPDPFMEGRWKITTLDGVNIALEFRSEQDAQVFIHNYRMNRGLNLDRTNAIRDMYTIGVITRDEARRALGANTEYRLEMENMSIHEIGTSGGGENGSNSFTMYHYCAENGRYEATFDLYVTGNEIDRITEGFRNHTIRILNDGDRRIEIDGHRLHCAFYSIMERISNPVSTTYEPRSFLNMYIDHITSRASTILPIYEVHMRDMDHKTSIEMTLSDDSNTFTDRINLGGPFNVHILGGNCVTLNGYSYRNLQPVQVTYTER